MARPLGFQPPPPPSVRQPQFTPQAPIANTFDPKVIPPILIGIENAVDPLNLFPNVMPTVIDVINTVIDHWPPNTTSTTPVIEPPVQPPVNHTPPPPPKPPIVLRAGHSIGIGPGGELPF